jgi:hypothetical protein
MQESLNRNEPVWFFCDILNQPVFEPEGLLLGRVADLAAAVLEHEALIKGVVIAGRHRSRRYLPRERVQELKPKVGMRKAEGKKIRRAEEQKVRRWEAEKLRSWEVGKLGSWEDQADST